VHIGGYLRVRSGLRAVDSSHGPAIDLGGSGPPGRPLRSCGGPFRRRSQALAESWTCYVRYSYYT
jgi:hypothetical protein